MSKGAILDKVYHFEHMFKAAHEGKLEVVKFLFDNGFDINMVDNVGETPIFKSINGKCFAVTKFLFENGANIAVTNKYGDSLEILLRNCDHSLLQKFFASRNDSKNTSKNNEEAFSSTNESFNDFFVKKLNPEIKSNIINQHNKKHSNHLKINPFLKTVKIGKLPVILGQSNITAMND